MRRLLPALALLTGCALAQDRGAAPAKKWTDQAEYALANAAATETDPAKKLADLDKWAASYPASEFSDMRQNMYLAFSAAQSPPLRKVEPQYSEEARLAGLEGSVLVTGAITSDGSLQGLRISRPLGLGLDEQAVAAVAQWRFAAGRRQPQSVTFPIDFVLPSKQSR
jgi:TonB family protein